MEGNVELSPQPQSGLAPAQRSLRSIRRLTKNELAVGALLWPEQGYWRPQTRQQCASVQRPCPYVACRHHLYLDVKRGGTIVHSFSRDIEPWQLVHSCVLDLAELGGMSLEQTGTALGITRERVRQLEAAALPKLAEALAMSPDDVTDALMALTRARDGDYGTATGKSPTPLRK